LHSEDVLFENRFLIAKASLQMQRNDQHLFDVLGVLSGIV
jgi:hypothetical protein